MQVAASDPEEVRDKRDVTFAWFRLAISRDHASPRGQSATRHARWLGEAGCLFPLDWRPVNVSTQAAELGIADLFRLYVHVSTSTST